MATANGVLIPPGYLGNLTPEQSQKLELLQTEMQTLLKDAAFTALVESNAVEFVDDLSYVLRFLRARKWDVAKAKEQIVNCLKWRKEFGIEKIFEKDLSSPLRNTGMAYYNLARDKFGRVIFNIHVRMNSKEGYVLEDIKKYTIFQMELGRRMIYPGAEMVTILFDMTDFAARHMDLGFVQFLVMALERYYPESLGVCLVYNAPWIFSPFWSMIKPWLDEVVAAKVQFAKGEELFKWVDKENLPKILGGNVEDPKHPVDSAVAYKSLVDEGFEKRGKKQSPGISHDLHGVPFATAEKTAAAVEATAAPSVVATEE